MKNEEKSLYEPVRKFLMDKFLDKFKNCHLEITFDGKFSEDMKRNFSSDVLFIHKQHLFPDLTGYVDENSSRHFITVEIKDRKIKIQDICQSMLYAEFFGAKFSFLISSAPIPEEIKRILEERPHLKKGHGYEDIILAHFRKDKGRILDWDWFPNPFK